MKLEDKDMSKIAFLFSGQGAQVPGMMKDIVDESSAAKEVFDTYYEEVK